MCHHPRTALPPAALDPASQPRVLRDRGGSRAGHGGGRAGVSPLLSDPTGGVDRTEAGGAGSILGRGPGGQEKEQGSNDVTRASSAGSGQPHGEMGSPPRLTAPPAHRCTRPAQVTTTAGTAAPTPLLRPPAAPTPPPSTWQVRGGSPEAAGAGLGPPPHPVTLRRWQPAPFGRALEPLGPGGLWARARGGLVPPAPHARRQWLRGRQRGVRQPPAPRAHGEYGLCGGGRGLGGPHPV